MLAEAKIELGFRINERDIRYLLWRAYKNEGGKRIGGKGGAMRFRPVAGHTIDKVAKGIEMSEVLLRRPTE